MNAIRRRGLTAGVAVGALAAGAGLAWWRFSPQPMLTGAEAAFWASQFEGPSGELVRLVDWQGKPLLVNFWATWCPPCLRELPLINQFAQGQAARGAHAVRVLGIAVDQVAAVNKWLARQPLSFPVALAGAGGVTLTRSLGNINGGLPFTILLDGKGHVQARKIGELSEKELQQWAAFS